MANVARPRGRLGIQWGVHIFDEWSSGPSCAHQPRLLHDDFHPKLLTQSAGTAGKEVGVPARSPRPKHPRGAVPKIGHFEQRGLALATPVPSRVIYIRNI